MADPIQLAFDYISKEWRVIRQAPIAFLLLIALGGGIGWIVVSQHYSERITALQATIDFLKTQLESKSVAPSQRTQDRQLSKEEERVLIPLLTDVGPHNVVVNYEGGDAEARAFAESLGAMFRSVPGWTVRGLSSFAVRLGPEPRKTGVHITITNQGEEPQVARILMASFKREEIAASLQRAAPNSKGHPGPRDLFLFVGSQP